MNPPQKTEHTLGNWLQSLPCGGPHSYHMLLTLMRMSPFLIPHKFARFTGKRNVFLMEPAALWGIVVITWHNYLSWVYLITFLFLSLFHVNWSWLWFFHIWGGWQSGESIHELLLSVCNSKFFHSQIGKAFVDVNMFF